MTNGLKVIMIALSLAALSCKKTSGCTDPTASNYMVEAQEEDGSCNYTSTISFHYNQATADSLSAHGAHQLVIMVNGESEKISPLNIWWSAAPTECKYFGAPWVTVNLGNSKIGTLTYQGGDNLGNVYWTGSYDVVSGGCTIHEFEW